MMKRLVVSVITLSRPVLALLSSYYLLQQDWLSAWLLFMGCVATDVIDGPLARFWQVETKFGQIIDLTSDILIFWLFIPATYWYSQKYSWWWQSNLPPKDLAFFAAVAIAVLVLFAATTDAGTKVFNWYKEKGNFWFGIIPVAAFGLWLSDHCGVWAVTLTVFYGGCACWLNRHKLVQHL